MYLYEQKSYQFVHSTIGQDFLDIQNKPTGYLSQFNDKKHVFKLVYGISNTWLDGRNILRMECSRKNKIRQ